MNILASLKEAVRSSITDVIAALHHLVPDWLLWLWSVPPRVWGMFFISLALAYSAAKLGWTGGVMNAAALLFAFLIGYGLA